MPSSTARIQAVPPSHDLVLEAVRASRTTDPHSIAQRTGLGIHKCQTVLETLARQGLIPPRSDRGIYGLSSDELTHGIDVPFGRPRRRRG